MKTHTTTTTTYSFSELSPEAQAHAIETRAQDPYNGEHEAPEAWDTAKAFNDLSPPRSIVSLDRREMATGEGSLDFDPVGMDSERAWVWLLHWVHESFDGVNLDHRKAMAVLGSCPLTGFFFLRLRSIRPDPKSPIGKP